MINSAARRLAISALAAVCLSLGVVAAPATAADPPTWTAPVDLTASAGYVGVAQVASAPDGTITAVWIRSNGSDNIVQTSSSGNGGVTWSAPVDLSAVGDDANVPWVAAAPDGTITIVWYRSNTVIQASSSTDHGVTWSAPVDLSTVGGSVTTPHMSIGPDGTRTTVWTWNNGSNAIVQTSSSPDGTSWSSPIDLSAVGGTASVPQVTTAADGTITVAWYRFNGSGNVVQTSSSTDHGLTWSAPINLSAAGATGTRVTAAADGTITVAWYGFGGVNSIARASSSSDRGITWSAAADLSAGGQNASLPHLASAPDGTITAVWPRSNGANTIIQSSSSIDHGITWSTPVDLSLPGGTASVPRLSTASDGTITAVWYRGNGGSTIVQASRSTDRGITWSAPADLSAVGGAASSPRPTTAPDGTVTVVWTRSSGGITAVQAAILAPVPAELPAGQLPAAEPALAATGTDTAPLALAAALLLLLGGSLAFRRRSAHTV